MTRHLGLLFALALAALTCTRPAAADGWLFRPSTFSHDADGNRVAQYQPERPTFFRFDDTYMESGYRHSHISIPGGDGSYDHLHVVQTWGLGESIRPYGEWLYPYRAGATPYGPWGNPSGPWTLPFDSWQNPYGLGKLPWGGYSPYYPHGGGMPAPYGGALPPGYGSGMPGYGGGMPGYGSGMPGPGGELPGGTGGTPGPGGAYRPKP
jgi:hypothetical protein